MLSLIWRSTVRKKRHLAKDVRDATSGTFVRLVDGADRLRDRGQHAAAAALYGAALDLAPTRHDIRVQYGNMLKDAGESHLAVDEYTSVLQICPDDPDVFHQRGRALLQLGHHDRARSDLEFAVSRGIEVVELTNLLGLSAERVVAEQSKNLIYNTIAKSSLFDRAYYRSSIPNLPDAADEIQHYIDIGHRHYCNPSPEFDAATYYSQVPASRTSELPSLAYALMHKNQNLGKRASDKPQLWSGDIGSPDLSINIERLRAESFSFRYGLGEDRSRRERSIKGASTFFESFKAAPESPSATIIIPVYGQTLWCLNCLDSLSTHRSRHSFEILVYDDGSSEDAMTGFLASIAGITYIRGGENKGFVDACNEAAKIARGEFLVLLNSDTRVCDGWLDELIGTFEIMPRAGLVGSKLFYGDGSLQEAGCIVWRDGSAWNYGRNDDPNDPRYCFARQVDYCSGAAIAMRRGVWEELGGFDPIYRPAYYEDVDLAFRVKDIGLEVWYQPLARVLHYEGKTHGTDVAHGGKAYQVVNAGKFAERWAKTLRKHRRNGDQPLAEADRSTSMRVLAIDAHTPTPDRDAGSVMTIRLLQILQRMGWRVTFVPAHDRRYSSRYSDYLGRIGIESINTSATGSIGDFVHSRPSFYAMVLGFRVTVLSDLMPLLRSAYPYAKILFHDIDLHYLRMEREAIVTESASTRLEAEAMKIRELALCSDVDCTIVPSIEEKKIIKDEIGADNVVVYPYTSDIVNSPPLNDKRRHIVFVGGFRHVPNVDAVQFFLDSVWPELSRRLDDDVKFYAVGPGAPTDLTSLADDRIIFTGYLENLSPILDQCRVFVAPLRFGAGLKGKVVTALSHGVPCVASGIAVEGMGLENERNVVVADEAEAVADQVCDLFADDSRWMSLRQEGLDFVSRAYSWEAGEIVAKEAIDLGGRVWAARQLSVVRNKVITVQRELAAQASLATRAADGLAGAGL